MAGDIAFIIQQIKEEEDYFKKAKLLRLLQKDRNVPIKYISEMLQMKASYVCHILRLNRLPDLVIDGYYSRLVSISHLFVIARLKSVTDMIALYETTLTESLSVYQTESKVREYLHNIKDEDGTGLSQSEIRTFCEKIQTQTPGVDVKIIQTRIKAKLLVEIKGNTKHTAATLRHFMKKLE